jgi:cystathionine beta-lyase family protein involved in aluminum resistance
MQRTIDTYKLIEEAEKELSSAFANQEAIAFNNQKRVLQAFANNRLSEEFFAEKTGYGLNDTARDVIDAIFAESFGAEAAAVRMQMVSGTHALACALFGNLKPGNRLACLTGAPYDTLQEVIGYAVEAQGSLKSLGVGYIEGNAVFSPDVDSELARLLQKPTTMAYIQKSCGYDFERKSLSNSEIAQLVKRIRAINPDCLVLVDNCYGEFVEDSEPTSCGADLMAGSLIKNPGGGLALTGGYVAGNRNAVEGALNRLTAPGIGGHLGLTYNQNRHILQGLFTAPSVVASAVKGAQLVSHVLGSLGLEVFPKPLDERFDIIQGIKFGKSQYLINFCRALQRFSPVNAHVNPEPAEMPGYQHKVVMAGGTFIAGSTIELSCDGPLREPYAGYLQGGLTYLHVKCALSGAINLALSGELPFFDV